MIKNKKKNEKNNQRSWIFIDQKMDRQIWSVRKERKKKLLFSKTFGHNNSDIPKNKDCLHFYFLFL